MVDGVKPIAMKWIFNIFIVCLFFACQYEKANNKVDFESDPIGAIPDETLEKASKAVSIPQSTEEPTIPVKHDVNVTKYKASVSKSNLRKAEYIVIAKSGLFLRGKPGTKSEKLTKIPYFSKVKVLNDISYKLDQSCLFFSKTEGIFLAGESPAAWG